MLLYVHLIILAFYGCLSFVLWKGFKNNDKLSRHNLDKMRENALIREGLREFNQSIQDQLLRNEKLVAETKKKLRQLRRQFIDFRMLTPMLWD